MVAGMTLSTAQSSGRGWIRGISAGRFPVLAYLQRHDAPLANVGYSLTTSNISTAFNTPFINEPCSKVSALPLQSYSY